MLVFLRNRFLWRPPAPIGFPLAGVWLTERLWLAIDSITGMTGNRGFWI